MAADLETLHKAVLHCLDVMARLARKQVAPTDPEPEELAALRIAADALPEMDGDPFLSTTAADLSPDGTSWHRSVYVRAKEWARRLTEYVADPEWRKSGQTMKMPALYLPKQERDGYEREKSRLLMEMKREMIYQRGLA